MKKALIISGFLLALSVTGCSAPQTAAPVAQPDDAARREADRAREDQREKDRERDQNRDAQHDRNQPCPDGEHLFTDRDGKTGCMRN